MTKRSLAVLTTVVFSLGVAPAQYVAVDITPPGYSRAVARSIDNGVVFGYGIGPGGFSDHAIMWNAGLASVTDLHPFGGQLSFSGVLRARNGLQVGVANATKDQASMWTGSAASYVSLHPTGADNSYARDTDGVMHAGYVKIGPWPNTNKAAIWLGSNPSYTLLHPSNALSSEATSIGDGAQGGWVSVESVGTHAALWNGTTAWIDLHPPGVYQSEVSSICPGEQGGRILLTSGGWGNEEHAAMWAGSAATFRDFNPPGYQYSHINRIYEGVQIGIAVSSQPNSGRRAGVWFGTPESYVDLGAYLPAGYSVSEAFDYDPATGDIVGYADNGQYRAILWRRDSVTPSISAVSPWQWGALGPDFELTVTGHNFSSECVVRWNGNPKPTTFVSDTELRAHISTSDLAHAGQVPVTVFTPVSGGIVSNVANVTVNSIAFPPTSLTLNFGNYVSGSLASVLNADQDFLVGAFSWTGGRTTPNLEWEYEAICPTETMDGLTVYLDSYSTISGMEQKIQVLNFLTGLWEVVDSFATTTQTTRRKIVIENAGRFLSSTRAVRVRTSYRAVGATPRDVRVYIGWLSLRVWP